MSSGTGIPDLRNEEMHSPVSPLLIPHSANILSSAKTDFNPSSYLIMPSLRMITRLACSTVALTL